MKIKLDLTKHCVETELRRVYNRSLSLYFKPGSKKERIEKIITVLKTVLENSDLNNLRNTYPELAGKSEANIILTTDRRDQVVILINGLKINIATPNPLLVK